MTSRSHDTGDTPPLLCSVWVLGKCEIISSEAGIPLHSTIRREGGGGGGGGGRKEGHRRTTGGYWYYRPLRWCSAVSTRCLLSHGRWQHTLRWCSAVSTRCLLSHGRWQHTLRWCSAVSTRCLLSHGRWQHTLRSPHHGAGEMPASHGDCD